MRHMSFGVDLGDHGGVYYFWSSKRPETRRYKMNRSATISASVMALLFVLTLQHVTLTQAAASSAATSSGGGFGYQLQFAQFRPPGLFDRGSCEMNCRSFFGGPSTWTGDRTETGPSADYLRCSYQCGVKDWNEQERLRNKY
jgi:hypothetical protein